MKKVVCSLLVLFTFFVSQSSGLTVFETFNEDVIQNGSWTYTNTIGTDGKNGGSVNYVGITDNTGGYVTYNVARDNDATIRLFKNFGETLTIFSNSSAWLEYDFQVLPNNSGAAYSLIGLFSGNENYPSTEFDTIALRPRANLGSMDVSVSNSGTAGITDSSGTTGTAWIGGINYRAKIKITGHKDGPDGTTGTMRLYMNADIYTLDGNTETLLTDGAEIKIFGQAYGFSLDSIGFGNNFGTRGGSGNFAIDNFYFSTEGPNANTTAPFVSVPEPATLFILSMGLMLIRRK
ncbi:MAG: PEP-CTERM sorting domain-containing protein [Phycisphaerales bacterium]